MTKVYEGDKDHVVVAGEYTGVNLTDGGQPFLHQAAVVCPAVAVVHKGVADNQGQCIATDRDGDKAFLVWQCRSPQPGARCEGEFQWTGGRNKGGTDIADGAGAVLVSAAVMVLSLARWRGAVFEAGPGAFQRESS